MAAAATDGGISSQLPLRMECISKCFGKLKALDDISLEVSAGECFGLLGPNGAGKSTLMRVIAGRVRPGSGSAMIAGDSAGSSRARRSLGWIPQELALYGALTCRENLLAFGRYQGLRGSPLQQAADWCLEWAGLTDRGTDRVRNLSGGMKRRLNMAAGLIHRPRLVLMDEPTTGVDPQSRNRIFEMIEQLRRDGTSVVYTTHYMEEAERLCDRIAIVDHGRIIALGTKDELVAQVFEARSEVVARFAGPAAAEFVAAHAGRMAGDAAQFTVAGPSDVSALLEAVSAAGLTLIDLSVHRPNLESVFLHLTGRGLRD
ncbi:MAG: ABC transporter ATP-binding protein [Acidobacteriota bacterium]|nr:ABC transporter ATP-binding protein [Acidobacteriota bacterium]